MTTKALFQLPVHKLRESLNSIDECTEQGHYSRPLNMQNSQGEMLYYELAGHPLPCTSDCQSSLRVLRAGATHFPQLRRLVCLLYEAITQHRLLESIDTALCAGNFANSFLKNTPKRWRGSQPLHVVRFLPPSTSFSLLDLLCVVCHCIEDICGAADSEDAVDQSIRLQQPHLPDLESHLHIEHVELIANVEKKFADDAEFPCCSCERLLQRKQVTAFNFSDTKFALICG